MWQLSCAGGRSPGALSRGRSGCATGCNFPEVHRHWAVPGENDARRTSPSRVSATALPYQKSDRLRLHRPGNRRCNRGSPGDPQQGQSLCWDV